MGVATGVIDAVRTKYSAVAESGLTGEQAGVRAVDEAFGYSAEELAAIPAASQMGLSCGNPTATANLRPGEVVVDLSTAWGLDVFLTARKVGTTGKAIGIDMTASMIELARRNASKARDEAGNPLTNVTFHLATSDRIPLEDASVDCVISNCVINLAPGKPAVLREIFRILKPGGRLAVSDIALKKVLPPEIEKDLMAYVDCIAGAVSIGDYEGQLKDAGFEPSQIVDAGADLNAYAQVESQAGCCSPAMERAPAPQSCCGPKPKTDAGCCAPAKEARVPVADRRPRPGSAARWQGSPTRYTAVWRNCRACTTSTITRPASRFTR